MREGTVAHLLPSTHNPFLRLPPPPSSSLLLPPPPPSSLLFLLPSPPSLPLTYQCSLLSGHLLLLPLCLLQVHSDLPQLFLHPPQCLTALLRRLVSLLLVKPFQLASQPLHLVLKATHGRALEIQLLLQLSDLGGVREGGRGRRGRGGEGGGEREEREGRRGRGGRGREKKAL